MNIDFVRAGEALGTALDKFCQECRADDEVVQKAAVEQFQKAARTAELLAQEADACWRRLPKAQQQEYRRFIGQLVVATQELMKRGLRP